MLPWQQGQARACLCGAGPLSSSAAGVRSGIMSEAPAGRVACSAGTRAGDLPSPAPGAGGATHPRRIPGARAASRSAPGV